MNPRVHTPGDASPARRTSQGDRTPWPRDKEPAGLGGTGCRTPCVAPVEPTVAGQDRVRSMACLPRLNRSLDSPPSRASASHSHLDHEVSSRQPTIEVWAAPATGGRKEPPFPDRRGYTGPVAGSTGTE